MYNIKIYETEVGNKPFESFLVSLAKKHKEIEIAQIKLYVKQLEKYGNNINSHISNASKYLREGIYELRPGNNRVLFFYCDGGDYILLHGFSKRTNKTPLKEIRKAINEKKDYSRRKGYE